MQRFSLVDLPTALDTDRASHDAVVLVARTGAQPPHDALREPLETLRRLDLGAERTATLMHAPTLPGGRLVLASCGSFERETDDVRRVAEACRDGVRRARDAGARKPLVVLGELPSLTELAAAPLVAALAALGAVWQPLEAREARGAEIERVETIGFAASGHVLDAQFARRVTVLDQARRLTRDLAGTEPERMAPARFVACLREAFAGTSVSVEVVEERATLEREYPLLSAVSRASWVVPRHAPAVVRLRYRSGVPQRTLLFAGKGLTYDTGGADLKVGGAMAGMSRDKGGAAALAGFMLALARLAPTDVEVVAELGICRNSVGADAFVTDEIIPSHAGVRVRIGNTDAEGRLVLADLLSQLRARALGATEPHIFSVATLTGHVARAYGPYTAVMDNGPARSAGAAERFLSQGERLGEPCELSRLRREDLDFVRPRTLSEDVLSCNNAPSAVTARGHQFPFAFLLIASGLEPHSRRESELPIPVTHLDIGGSAIENCDWQFGQPTAAPLLTLLGALFPEL